MTDIGTARSSSASAPGPPRPDERIHPVEKGTTKHAAGAVSGRAARLSVATAAVALVLLALLHLLRPELDPSWQPISEYALGEHGWIMTLAFLAWGLSAIGLFVAIRSQTRTVGGRIGLGFLLIGAAGPILAAVFPADPITTPPDALTTNGTLHSLGAVLGGNSLPIAAALLTWSLTRSKASWSSVRRRLVWATVLAWAGLIVFSVSMAILLPRGGGQLGPEVAVGWQNRFMVVTYLAWLAIAAGLAVRAARQPIGPNR